MTGKSLLGLFQALQFATKQRYHLTMPVQMASMGAPGRDYDRSVAGDFNKPVIVFLSDGVGLGLHHRGKSRPKGEYIHHAKRAKTPSHRIIDASRNSWIILHLIGSGRVEPYEHGITGIGEIPLAPKCVAILSTFGKYSASFHALDTPWA